MKSLRAAGVIFIALAAIVWAGSKKFEVHTTAFREGADIPKEFTCGGSDISPALAWSHAPEKTKTFALIVEDPDAPGGTFYHWLVWNIPESIRQLSAGERPPATEGKNGFEVDGYRGPCPPPGAPHRYFFRLYALDTSLNLPAGAPVSALTDAMRGHQLAETAVMGRFGR